MTEAVRALFNSINLLPVETNDAHSGGWLVQSRDLDVSVLSQRSSAYLNGVVTLLQSIPKTGSPTLHAIPVAVAVDMATQVATSSALVSYESYEQALAARDQAHALLDACLEVLPILMGTIPIDIYESWRELKALIADSIQQQALSLPHIRYAQVSYPKPALVLVDQIYNNALQASELIVRNQVIHPLFVQGTLEYLAHG